MHFRSTQLPTVFDLQFQTLCFTMRPIYLLHGSYCMYDVSVRQQHVGVGYCINVARIDVFTKVVKNDALLKSKANIPRQ